MIRPKVQEIINSIKEDDGTNWNSRSLEGSLIRLTYTKIKLPDSLYIDYMAFSNLDPMHVGSIAYTERGTCGDIIPTLEEVELLITAILSYNITKERKIRESQRQREEKILNRIPPL